MASIALPARSRDPASGPTGLAVAFLLSAAIHLVFASMLGVLPSFSVGSGRELLAEKTLESKDQDRQLRDPNEPDEVRPGSPESNATSITWIGYDEYSPHAATSGEVDQPQLTFDPPGGPPVESALAAAPANEPPTESVEASTPARASQSRPPAPPRIAEAEMAESPPESVPNDRSEPPAEPARSKPALTDPLGQPDMPQPEVREAKQSEGQGQEPAPPPPLSLLTAPEGPEPSTGVGALPVEIGPEPVYGPVVLPPAPNEPSPKPEKPPEAAPPQTEPTSQAPFEQPRAQSSPLATTPTVEPPPDAPTSPPVPAQQYPVSPAPAAPPAPGGDQAGRQADRESDAASVIHVPEARLGQPLVGKGLEIRTVKPRFSHHTILTARPSDPVLRVLFDRDGKVTDVEILRSSGVQDVDRPLLDAVFQWRARGEQLKKLRPGTPRETVAMEFRILL